MKKLLFAIIILFLSTIVLFAGGRRDVAVNDGRLNVVTSIFPAFDFVREIAGDRVNLTMLIAPGAESHSFEPSPRDIITINNSDVFIYTGGDKERWINRILHSLNNDNIRVFAMVDMVDLLEEEFVEGMDHGHDHHHAHGHDHHHHAHGHHHGHHHAHAHGHHHHAHDHGEHHYDTHVWTSPRNAIQIVRAITDALSEADPANAYFFRQNAAAYIEELQRLDAAFAEVVNNAARQTIIVGDRFPFRYFTDAYGLTYFAAFSGCSTLTDASPATIAFLINRVRDEQIPVVFHIELSNELIANVIAEETGARKLLLHSAHNVSWADFNAGLSYLEIKRRNVDNLRIALN